MGLAGVGGGGEALPWCGGGDAAATPNHNTRHYPHTVVGHTHTFSHKVVSYRYTHPHTVFWVTEAYRHTHSHPHNI